MSLCPRTPDLGELRAALSALDPADRELSTLSTLHALSPCAARPEAL